MESNPEIIIKRIISGKWEENCYIVSKDKEAIVIDPGDNVDQMIRYLQDNHLTVSAVLNTHAHFDHIGGVNTIVNTYECPFYLHSKDERLLKSANLYMTFFEGEKRIKVPIINEYLDKTESPLKIGNLSITILLTPGHTLGGVSFLIENNLFTGDTLLKDSVGRVDLPGANKLKLEESLQLLSVLNPDFIIYSGHGDSTTLKEELIYNKYLIELIS